MKKKRGPLTTIRKGFALAETVIALLILSIAILAMASVPIMATKLTLQTVQRERAYSLADHRLDILESLASQDISGTETVDIYTVSFDKSSAGSKAVVNVTWNSVTSPSTVTLERDLSEISSTTAVR